MSTKIYNGYIIPEMTMLEIQEFCIRVSKKIKQKRVQLFSSLLANLIATNFDKHQFGFKIEIPKNKSEMQFKDSFYFLYYFHIQEMVREIEKTQQRNPMFDFGFSLCFIPIVGKLLCLLYTDKSEFTTIWESFDEVSDYHYQNQTDPPPIKEISEQEWEQRHIDWDIALPGIGIPSESGFTFEPRTDLKLTTPENLLNYIPDKETRTRLIAQEILWQKYLNEQTKDETEFKYSMYFDFKDKLQKQFKEEFEQKISEIEPQIIELTKELLLQEHEFNC